MRANGVTVAELKTDVDTLAAALPLLPTFCPQCDERVMRDPDMFFASSRMPYHADQASVDSFGV